MNCLHTTLSLPKRKHHEISHSLFFFPNTSTRFSRNAKVINHSALRRELRAFKFQFKRLIWLFGINHRGAPYVIPFVLRPLNTLGCRELKSARTFRNRSKRAGPQRAQNYILGSRCLSQRCLVCCRPTALKEATRNLQHKKKRMKIDSRRSKVGQLRIYFVVFDHFCFAVSPLSIVSLSALRRVGEYRADRPTELMIICCRSPRVFAHFINRHRYFLLRALTRWPKLQNS